jgi:hypothetical protein
MEVKKISLKQFKQLLKLIDDHRLDFVEFNGVTISKKHPHFVPAQSMTPKFGFGDASTEPTTVEELDAEITKAMGL